MQKKTEIVCGVQNCIYNHEEHCDADTITVTCNNCVKPSNACETECKSFQSNAMK